MTKRDMEATSGVDSEETAIRMLYMEEILRVKPFLWKTLQGKWEKSLYEVRFWM